MTTHKLGELVFRKDWFSHILKMTSYLCLSLSAQFWCGEWPVGGTQPPGPPGQPRLRSGRAAQLPSQPAAGILPLPLRLWLWPFTQGSVQKLLHSQWPVSSHTLTNCWQHASQFTSLLLLKMVCKLFYVFSGPSFNVIVLVKSVYLWMRFFFSERMTCICNSHLKFYCLCFADETSKFFISKCAAAELEVPLMCWMDALFFIPSVP